MRTVWVLAGIDAHPVRIRIGISDGTVTEVTDGELQAGDALVTEATGTDPDNKPQATPPGGAAPGGGLRRVF